MYLNIKKLTVKTVLLSALIFAIINSSAAEPEIENIFSDFTSSDVTINSSQDIQNGRAVFELFYEKSLVESHEVPFRIDSGESVSKVVLWQKKPQHDYYTATVSLYDDSTLLDSISYPVSYGTVSLPSFHVVGFSPTNSGILLLLRPFNPSVVDIELNLLEKNDIVYTEKKEDVALTVNTEIKTTWPFLLTNNKKYTVRAKIYTHRLYAPPLINTYVADFTATDDIEILRDDVEVDEYGASVTVRGKSQVPFDGYIVVTARNKATNETQIYRQQMEEILVSGKEDTAGVVWKVLPPGAYDIEIRAVNGENVTLDKYETVLRIPELPTITEVPARSTPGFILFISLLMLLAAAKRLKGERKKSGNSGENR